MSHAFPLHFDLPTAETAPEASRPLLAEVKATWGFAPNLIRLFANSPATLQGIWGILGAFDKSSFTPAERQAVLLAASIENDCHYCTAAHTTMGARAGLTKDQLDAIRAEQAVADPKLEALRHFTKLLVANRGYATESEVNAFLAAGYKPEQVLEVVLGIAAKTLTNYTNHLTGTPLDDAFKANAFTPRERASA
jgi:uncharacterized peroxidase-related enzyme